MYPQQKLFSQFFQFGYKGHTRICCSSILRSKGDKDCVQIISTRLIHHLFILTYAQYIIIHTLNPLISDFHTNTSHSILSSFHDISRILLSLQPEIYLLSKHVCNPVKYDKWDAVQHTYSTKHSNKCKKPMNF